MTLLLKIFRSFFRTIAFNPSKIEYELFRVGPKVEEYFGNKTVTTLRSFWNKINVDLLDIMWNERFNVSTAEILTGFGYGHSFNIAPSHEFFDEVR